MTSLHPLTSSLAVIMAMPLPMAGLRPTTPGTRDGMSRGTLAIIVPGMADGMIPGLTLIMAGIHRGITAIGMVPHCGDGTTGGPGLGTTLGVDTMDGMTGTSLITIGPVMTMAVTSIRMDGMETTMVV